MDIGSLTAKLRLDGEDFKKGLDKAQSSMKSASASMKKAGRTMTMSVTAPLIGIGAASAKMASDFESEMSKVNGLVGVAQEQVDKWGQDIIKMAPELGKAPKELAQGLFFVTSAGIKGAAAMDTLRISAQASAAGLGETKTVADLVTSAMNAYGQENLSASQSADILAATVREGKAEASELASSMGQVLPIAAEMEVSFDQVGAAMAGMTRSGTSASEASTALRSILTGVLKPTQQSAEALEAMGMSFSDVRRTIREDGLFAALSQLKDITNEYGEEAMSNVFPNVRALSGVLDLMGKNAGSNAEIFKNLTDSTGSLDKAFASASDTAEFRYNKALSGMKSAGVALGGAINTAMVPILEKLSSLLQRVTTWFTSLSDSQQQWIVRIGGAIAAIGPLLLGLGAVVGLIGNLVPLVKGAAVAFKVLGAAMKANPIGFIIAGIALVVHWIAKAWRESEVFRAVVKTVVAKVGAFFKKLGIRIKYEAIEMWEQMKAKFKAIGQAGAVLWDTLKAVFQKGKSPREVFKEGFAKIGSDMAAAGSEARENMERELNAIKTPNYKEILAKEQAAQAAKEAGKESAESYTTGFEEQAAVNPPSIPTPTVTSGGGGTTREPGAPMSTISSVDTGINVDPLLAQTAAMKKMRDEMAKLNSEQKLFGNSSDIARQKQMLLKQTMLGLLNEGVAPSNAQFKMLKMQFDSLNVAQTMTREQFSETQDKMSEFAGSVESVINASLQNMVANFVETAAAGGNVFASTLSMLADLMMRLGKMAIGVGIGVAAIKAALESLNPIVALAAGAALIALSVAVRKKASSMAGSGGGGGGSEVTRSVQGLATGGYVQEGGMFKVGERGSEMVHLPAGSAVTPHNQMSQGEELKARISGQDLEIVLERWKKSKGQIT
jgi:TP901 family phage tail tape measure protein